MLYNMAMGDLSQIFSSKARFSILRLLSNFEFPLALRQIELHTGLSVRSVQLALDHMYKEGLLKRRPHKNATLYSMDKKCVIYKVLKEIFLVIQNNEILQASGQFQSKAKTCLLFSQQMLELNQKAKPV
jgi:predicted DNA-binding transcriptional regulator